MGFLLAHVLNYLKDATRKSVRQLSCIFNISPSSLEPSHHITQGPSRQFVRETVWRLRRNSYLLCGKCFMAVRKWVAWWQVLLLFTYDDNKKVTKVHRCRQVRTDPILQHKLSTNLDLGEKFLDIVLELSTVVIIPFLQNGYKICREI